MYNDKPKVVMNNNSIGFCGIFFIILFLLKVGVLETVVVGWSWWWITVPLWGPIVLVFGIPVLLLVGAAMVFLGCVVCTFVASLISNIKRRLKRRANAKQKL